MKDGELMSWIRNIHVTLVRVIYLANQEFF